VLGGNIRMSTTLRAAAFVTLVVVSSVVWVVYRACPTSGGTIVTIELPTAAASAMM
jgi:hypothetical protein